jgi:mono/diheme cytochrome c family protein
MPLQSELGSGSAVWDAETKRTNVISGADFVRFSFNFTNVSGADLTISNVQTSCGCTTVQLPSLPWVLPSGGNGQLSVNVNLTGKAGTLVKTITVSTDQGTKMLTVKIIIDPPPEPASTETARLQNMRIAENNRQAIFYGECASCHVRGIEGQYGKQLFEATCRICHEAADRASMMPDLRKLDVPTDENFWRTWISYGKAGSLMPAFAKTENGPFSDTQIMTLAAYLNAAIPSRN